MNDEQDWLVQQLNQQASDSSSFVERALFTAAENLVIEQGKRIDQHEGELDGRIWNPDKW